MFGSLMSWDVCKPATELNLLIGMLYLIASARHLCHFHYVTILLWACDFYEVWPC